MKRHLLGILPIAIAVVTVGFTKKKEFNDVYFTFDAGVPNASNVSFKDNWVEEEESDDCIGDNQACQLRFTSGDLIGTPGTGRRLSVAAPTTHLNASDPDSDGKYSAQTILPPYGFSNNKP